MIKMDILFKNQTTLNKSVTIELFKASNKPYLRIILLFAIFIYVYLTIDLYLHGDYIFFIIYCIGIFVLLLCFVNFWKIQGTKSYKKQIILGDGKDPELNIVIYDDYIELNKKIYMQDENSLSYKNELETKAYHKQINVVYKMKNVFVIVYGNKICFPIDMTKFTTGTPEEFEQFLLKKGIKIKRKIL
ncbi:MAG: hypothetical protein J6D47_13170 [Peptostreptococcaceae bacterium]|nr:hypothetical protein [Peptostreptococcaceae bacterium]